MTQNQSPIDNLQVKSPCDASWKDMLGGVRSRHCEKCDLHVHNLSGMSRAEGEALLTDREPEARVCIRLEYHADGTPITTDHPLNSPAEAIQPNKAAAAALAFGAGLLAACGTDRVAERGEVSPANLAIDEPPVERALLGDVVFEPLFGEVSLETMGRVAFIQGEDTEACETEPDSKIGGPTPPPPIMGSPGVPKPKDR